MTGLVVRTPVTVLDPHVAELHDQYVSHLAIVERAAGNMALGQMEYWLNLWLIHSNHEYRAKGYLTEEQWLREDFLAQSFAPSRASYKGVMTAIQDWYALGCTDQQVMLLLADRKMAVERDLRSWFVPGTERQLKPEVKMMLAAKGETPPQALDRIRTLPPDQARAATGEVVDRDYWRVVEGSAHYLAGARKLTFNVRHEHTRKGLLECYTVSLGARRTDELRGSDDFELSFELIQWVLSNFGQRYP